MVRATAALVLTILVLASRSAALAQSPSPEPSACPPAAPITAGDAFAHVIDDPRTLAFFELVADANPDARSATLARAAKARDLDHGDTVAHAVDATCATSEFALRSARLEYLVADRWNARAARDLLRPMHLATGALEAGDAVAPDLRDRILAIFGTTNAKLDARVAKLQLPTKPQPRDKPYDPCNGDARVTMPVLPDYPDGARRLGLGGTFLVAVSVDASGLVRSAKLQSAITPATDEPLDELTNRSIVVAAVSRYAPGFADCKPVPGTYVYRTEFLNR